MRQEKTIKAALGRQRPSGHHLKLIQYWPPGGEPHVCAAIWREGDHVHLASPLLRTRNGIRDPRSYVRQFPDGLASIDAFEDTMAWLEAACYAAADPCDIETSCQQHPEWQLRCIRYDGSDATLLGLAGLIRAVERVGPLPEPIMRDCLLELIRQILRNAPELVGAQIESAYPEGDDVARLDLGLDRAVLVTMLRDIAPTDVVHQGLLAHHRMMDKHKDWTQCLLVLPELELDRPMFMSPRVAITNMDPDHMRTTLVRMAKR